MKGERAGSRTERGALTRQAVRRERRRMTEREVAVRESGGGTVWAEGRAGAKAPGWVRPPGRWGEAPWETGCFSPSLLFPPPVSPG